MAVCGTLAVRSPKLVRVAEVGQEAPRRLLRHKYFEPGRIIHGTFGYSVRYKLASLSHLHVVSRGG